MNTQRIVFIGCLMVIGLLPLACGIGTSQATPNLDATVQAAIAQTRTFEGAVATSVAATAVADTPATVADTPKPTATNVPATTPTDTPQAPTPIPPPHRPQHPRRLRRNYWSRRAM